VGGLSGDERLAIAEQGVEESSLREEEKFIKLEHGGKKDQSSREADYY